MKVMVIILLLLGGAQWASLLADPSPFTDLVGFITFLCLVAALPITAGIGIFTRGLFSTSWLLPPMICGVFLLGLVFAIPSKLNGQIAEWHFNREFGEYTKAVDDIKAGNVRTSQKLDIIDMNRMKNIPKRVIQVRAAHCNHGTVVVEFLVSNKGRYAWGYLFDDCDDPSISLIQSSIYNKSSHPVPITGHWYKSFW